MKKCVVSFANGPGHYLTAMKRLEKSFKDVGFDGDCLMFSSYEEIGSPTHQEVPYAFKAYSIKKAIELDYDLILWADSVVHASKSVAPVFDHIEKYGYLFFDNIGWTIGDYTSDACLKKMGMTREKAFETPMIMAACMGFNLNALRTSIFLNHYIGAADDGISYHGDWNNNKGQVSKDPRVRGTRHDQSVASILIAQMGLTLTTGHETYFAYVDHKKVLPVSETVCLWSGGL